MKKLIAIVVLLLLGGCAPTLAEIRASEPVAQRLVKKTPECVHSKLTSFALEYGSGEYFKTAPSWEHSYDPTTQKGELVGSFPSANFILFVYNTIPTENGTSIIMKSFEKEERGFARIGFHIFNKTDFSLCPEK
ncbi:MAG TPA: hypothetical protein DEQ20_03995 [Desulfobulbaceae bacterium]|nr:MAG: hypothetical protein A2520_00865 [Deltaproteobacteria bacterium RIFOXYD12_FULL_53_23]HCC54075.1 hypothetical protein [Desulfobulbaceae bacterium]